MLVEMEGPMSKPKRLLSNTFDGKVLQGEVLPAIKDVGTSGSGSVGARERTQLRILEKETSARAACEIEGGKAKAHILKKSADAIFVLVNTWAKAVDTSNDIKKINADAEAKVRIIGAETVKALEPLRFQLESCKEATKQIEMVLDFLRNSKDTLPVEVMMGTLQFLEKCVDRHTK